MSDKTISGQDKPAPSDEWLADLYKQDQAEPDAALDAAVLNMAREQHPSAKKDDAGRADAPVSPAHNRRWLRWGGGLATAAVVLVSVSVFLQVDETQLAPSTQSSADDNADSGAFAELEVAAKQVRAEEMVAAQARVTQANEYRQKMQQSVEQAQAPAAPAEPSINVDAPDAVTMRRVSAPMADMAQLASTDAQGGRAAIEEVVVTGSKTGEAPSWQTSDALSPDMTFFYPNVDSQGQPVVVDTYLHKGARQVHAYSRDRSDVYFEVLLYPEPIDIEAQYLQQKQFIERDDERKQQGQVADLIDTFLQGRKARQATITFNEGDTTYQRRMYFLNTEVGGQTVGLRVVMDPRSQTNHEMVEYLEFN